MTAWYRWHRYNLTTWLQLLRFQQAATEHLYFKVWDLGQNDNLLNMDELVKHFSPRWQKVSNSNIRLHVLEFQFKEVFFFLLSKCFKLFLSCIFTLFVYSIIVEFQCHAVQLYYELNWVYIQNESVILWIKVKSTSDAQSAATITQCVKMGLPSLACWIFYCWITATIEPDATFNCILTRSN